MEQKFKTYNQKCKMVCFRLRKDKDSKYIDFLNNCPNKAEFLRNAIDREIERS